MSGRKKPAPRSVAQEEDGSDDELWERIKRKLGKILDLRFELNSESEEFCRMTGISGSTLTKRILRGVLYSKFDSKESVEFMEEIRGVVLTRAKRAEVDRLREERRQKLIRSLRLSKEDLEILTGGDHQP